MGAIICGIDESEAARGAARVARGLSGELGLDLVFVHVLERPSTRVDAAVNRLANLDRDAGDGGAEWIVAVGHPADQLVAAAANTEATLIVVGCHGPRSSSLGSISAEVSRRAACPVVVVPPGADQGFHSTTVTGSSGNAPDTAAGALRSA
jgi:nucleotide-binding universal stress UspA family protein